MNPQQCFDIPFLLMKHTCTTETLTLNQQVHTAIYHSRSNRQSVMKIQYSMRMPWVQYTRSVLYFSLIWRKPLLHHQLYMIGSCILEHRSNYYFDIVTSVGIPASSIYMSHIICIFPIDGNHINTKTKPTMPQPWNHHLHAANPLMSVSHTLSSYRHTSRGNMLTQKSPTNLSMAYTT